MLRRLNELVLIVSTLTLAVAFLNRNDLPGDIDFRAELEDEPRQRPIDQPSVTVPFGGIEYRVEPLYDYELYGLVVSYRQHDGRSFMHSRANDHLNVADVCVVWGETATRPTLHELSFWNGIFTCNVQTRDTVAWSNFDMKELSNNHLISADSFIRDRVAEIKVGDQIRVKGSLARYGAAGGAVRGTSTTRDDTGDGACETIFVKEFEIVTPGKSNWRAAMWTSLVVLLGALAVHFALPYRPYRD